jgi:hypothetical protein
MARVAGGEALQVTKPTGASRRIEVLRRRTATGTATMILYRCPACARPCRYLYPLTVSDDTLVDWFGLQCQSCAGLRWASQGRYRSRLDADALAAIAADWGLPYFGEPLPRCPWDPRAVSDPRMVVDEFPNLRKTGRANDNHRSRSANSSRGGRPSKLTLPCGSASSRRLRPGTT